MATLLDSLTSLASPAVGPLSEKLGENDIAISHAIPSTFASVLGGVIAKSTDPIQFDQIFELISAGIPGTNLTADLKTALTTFVPGTPAYTVGTKFLGMLFGNRVGEVGDLLTRTAGFKNAASGSSLLSLAAPVVLGFLNKKVTQGKLNPTGLASLLNGERRSILSAAPAGLTNLTEPSPSRHRVDLEWERAAELARREYAGHAGARSSRWLWPTVGLVSALLVWFAASRQNHRVARNHAAVSADSMARRSGSIESSAGEVVGGSSLGAFYVRNLPNGVTLNIPRRGVESKLVDFIESPTPASPTASFDFDRIAFANNSAMLLPTSDEQIKNIANVLKAYPNVKVKIGGYTDNIGGAGANQRLSQKRADAVKQALVRDGISPRRMRAEGYGEKYPIASNSTAEGRAQNRRIALRVTAK